MSSRIALAVCTARPSTQLSLCEYLHDRISEQPEAESWWLMLVEDSSLSIEHALQLQTCERVLFVHMDACSDKPPGYSFKALDVEVGHKILPAEGNLSPADLMHALATMRRRGASPSGFLLAVSAPPLQGGNEASGEDEKAELDHSVKATLDAVAGFLAELLQHSDLDFWLSKTTASEQYTAIACEN